jgi:signal transduction histidine kinase
MKLKYRFPLLFSLLFSILLGAVLLTVYYLFADFRKVEFTDRLSERVQTTGKLLLEVKEVDSAMLRIIDRNTINQLYNERVQIYDDNQQLIYSSNGDTTVHWSSNELNLLKIKKEIFNQSKAFDIVGLHYGYGNRDYYLFISAEDKYGNRKLNYLKLLLVSAYLLSILLLWLLAFYLSQKTLKPLHRFTMQIQEINTKNLTVRLDESGRKDEIKDLSHSFNGMMNRINEAYKSQEEFTSNASHELRTPVTRIVMQLENLMKTNEAQPTVKKLLASISEDAYQLSDSITSLLLLSKMEVEGDRAAYQKVRIDEVLFAARGEILKLHPDFKFHFTIESKAGQEVTMEITGDESLLKIAFQNLLKNAYHYSDNQTVYCIVQQEEQALELLLVNTGDVPKVSNTKTLFNTFTRGSNVNNKPGSGIGLSIVKRILTYHHASITYKIPDARTNKIVVSFKLS